MKKNNGYLILAGLLLMVFNACQTQKHTPIQSGQEYAIAYNVLIDEEGDDYEVFSMNLDGSNKKNISNLKGVEWTYISVYDKVLYISDKDTCQRCYFLYEMDCQGDQVKKMADIKLADSWMSSRKNGTELIVKPHPKIDSSFYIIDRNGTILQKVYTGLPAASDPLFVNKGRQVVFRGGRTKSKLMEGFNEELYLIDADGSNRKQLTQYPKNDTTASKFAYHAGPPKLHPSGKYVTYQSMQSGKYSLYAVSLDGKKQWKLTNNAENEGWHDWSPDGKWLAIELFDDEQTQFHIGLMNWETQTMQILTDTSYRYQQCPNFVRK